ncbi:DNA-binding transcriptional MerR regulator [Amycolatopsis bartoniae]|uniref:MerR family transcriptional regulator n=1 Tax=Amycolatopsis bartoniae TaxID=941986 RepID=A0A8H9MEW9_9PSEU|nr:MerR family transcriptional regulator [Amycolatopsis bartoniae]MBB2938974.1 DNA-binding transcriptional MerR regulator [Amycolatopsis bartoniae]TVT11225.1 MerR family transcriptional regulator [Amycolatopsis bartoniae]GHF65834.1 MerR family transcriptional regulator [Amycolatopsis bartoniae]
MRIGELAERSGVSVRSLRYYEEQRLLEAERSPNGQRRYDEDAVHRVQLIQLLYRAGVPSRTIHELLPSIETGEVTAELLDRLLAERDRIDDQLATLTSARHRLQNIISLAIDAREAGRRCPHWR